MEERISMRKRPKCKVVYYPDCDDICYHCDSSWNAMLPGLSIFDYPAVCVAKTDNSYFSQNEKVEALLAALKEITGKEYQPKMGE